uniref:NADH-ubiquinone oxidoreductase chain 6 n=1 Tax=Abscondita anceyi TaxID=2307266 RepID=A0A346T623_9COLE|nr:NADH dehydrogenase subunit 6 [Abscondita anceyi]AXU05706.1 NADH dehydrogenase subunit 6 [Abscondita anceyi]UYG49049.1 NADH dehydrogenase subunit 6 [Abscondita chinensis]UYG49062.1 NADH dehydrogenase subunit 6 [Abscondita chinensis]
MTLLMIMITLSISFMLVSHPLSMGMILLTQTLMIAMWTGFMSMNFWYSYILFIVMVGGMLILFIYMTSVASNEKFLYSKLMTMMMIIMFMALIIIKKDQLFMLMNSMNYDLIAKNNLTFKMSLNKFIMYPMMIMSLTIIIYLLIALIAVSKITNVKNGPLRKNI